MKTYSQIKQDLWMVDWFREKGIENGIFYDVGAYDGILFSNSLLLEEMGWRGHCFEPNPYSFERLVKNRPLAKCWNVAIDSEAGRKKFNVCKSDSPEWRGGMLSTLGEPENERWGQLQWEEIEVETRPLSSFDGKPDLLLIDAEGHDLTVLKSWDFTKHKPGLICIEIGSHKGMVPILDFLEPLGYDAEGGNGQDIFVALQG